MRCAHCHENVDPIVEVKTYYSTGYWGPPGSYDEYYEYCPACGAEWEEDEDYEED